MAATEQHKAGAAIVHGAGADPDPTPARGPMRFHLTTELAIVFSIWVLSDMGYYLGLPLLGISTEYNKGSVGITLFYLFWVGVIVVLFWPAYASWPRYAAWPTFRNRLSSLAIWIAGFAAMVYFAGWVLPGLPPFYWPEGWGEVPALPLATPMYFLPKSIEILFQQLEVVVVVLLLAARNLPLWKISLWCAVMFGGAHVLLLFSNVPLGYVNRFTVSAFLFGLVFPYFILRMSSGFAITYAIHWGYYALTILLARELGPKTYLSVWGH